MIPLLYELLRDFRSLQIIIFQKIRNPNLEIRNKFEYRMTEIKNKFRRFEILILKIVSYFEFRASDLKL